MTEVIVEVEDAALVDELLVELGRRPDVVVERLEATTLEVGLLGSYTLEAMQLAVELRIRSWEMARRDAGNRITVEFAGFTGFAPPHLHVRR